MEYQVIEDHKTLTAIFEWDDCTSYNCKIGDFHGGVTFYDNRVLMSFTYKARTYQAVTYVACHDGYTNAELFFTSFAMAILNTKSKHKSMKNVYETFKHSGARLADFYSVDNLYKKNLRTY